MNPRIDQKYWMRIAVEAAKASTCRADVGCVLIHKKTLVGMGYVGSVHGDHHCMSAYKTTTDPLHNHILMRTDRQGSTKKGNTCIRTIHAEMNAVLKCTVRGSKEGGWIDAYSTYQPCLDCTKVLLQIGVRTIYYMKPYKDLWRDEYLDQLDSFMFHKNSLMIKVEL